MGNMYRAQLLLEPEQHRALAEIAREEGRSISEVVREIVREHLAERSKEARTRRALEALDKLTEMRKRIEAEHGVYMGDLLAEARDEREAERERIWRGEP